MSTRLSPVRKQREISVGGGSWHNPPVRLAAVSVDLDEITNYHQIHGLSEAQGLSRTLVYDVAVPRLLDFAGRCDLPLTFFAIGRDLERAAARETLRRAREAGHEIANHSLDHMYDFTRLTRAGIRTQVEGGVRAIADAVGVAPVGFRAPGYTVTDEVFAVLSELGVQYDSSVFPCPAYFAAKAAAIGAIALAGRRSESVVDTPKVLSAPRRPYRVGRPYWTEGDGVLELPIQVTRGMRLPFIGTSLTLAGVRGAKLLTKMCVGEPLVNLELHGIDLLDEGDGLFALSRHQRDVRVLKETKLAVFETVVATLREAGYRFITLADATRQISM